MKDERFGFVAFRSFNLEGTALSEFKEGIVQEHGNDVQVEAPMRCAVSMRKSVAVT